MPEVLLGEEGWAYLTLNIFELSLLNTLTMYLISQFSIVRLDVPDYMCI